jgi:Asp-tRNA(Asn)/Glu-tRNA(Gln) amidotransferase A subunit family amidase
MQEFTHFGNVLDLCCVATPAGTYKVSEATGNASDEGTLPFSVTFLGKSQRDSETLAVAGLFEEHLFSKDTK